jgi:4-aminobutyrate aminotransferase / (S)-3-amino-2-methylpropionate transaminase / 5-aminovalerate transaminase
MNPVKTATQVPGTQSQAINDLRITEVSAAVSPYTQIYISHAEGSILTDVDGQEYLDFGCGIGVTTLGHGNAAVIDAAVEQIKKFTHTLFTITPYESYVRVAQKLNQIAPGNFAKKSVLSSTGAEAVENAIKIARAHTRRNGIAVLDHGYHGRTNLTLGLNYKAVPLATGAGPRPGEIYRAPNSHPYLDGVDGPTAARRAIAYLEKISGAENLACFLIEPIQGEGGVIEPAPGFLNELQKWCNDNGIVVIADEIQTGLGRTGKLFASEHFDFVPDLVVTAKAIAGGIPVSAVTGRAEMMDSMKPGALSGTYSGNPVGCAASLAVLDQLTAPGMMERATEIGHKIQARLHAMKASYPVIGDVRGQGALHGLELVHPDKSPNPDAFKAVSKRAAELGLLVLPGGSDGHVLRLLPAITISDELLEQGLNILDQAFSEI